jgi:predicted RNase H-like HicB family nuclease
MKYKVNLKKTEEGYSAWVPGLPGCWSQGHTEDEASDDIRDATQAYLEAVEELSKNRESRYVEVGWGGLMGHAGRTMQRHEGT